MILLPSVKKTEPVIKEKAIKIVYCLYRVSTKNQVDHNDIPMQRNACREFVAEQSGWIIKKEFMKMGVSGFKVSAEDRDQLQELRMCAERKEFDVLLVFMFDRLGRRDDETPFVLRWFTEHGIEVWSVKEGQQVFDSCVDDLINYVRFWTAKTESIKTSMRVRTKLRQMVEEGKYTGGCMPFGYNLVPSGEINKHGRVLHMPSVDADEAKIVKLIFKKTTLEGMGTYKLAELINKMGITTHTGSKFHCNTVNRILRNPIYCGYYYKAGTLSPRISNLQIIEDDVFNEAQRILDSRAYKKREKDVNSLYAKASALLVGNGYCEFCGSRLIVTSHSYSYCTIDGERHYRKYGRYMCTGSALCRTDCKGQGTFTVKKVDAKIEDHIKKLHQKLCKMSDVDAIDHKYKSVVANLKKRIGELKFHEENISYKLKTLYAEIADSISGLSTYSPEQLSEAITELRSKQESVKLKLAQLQNEAMDRTQIRSSIQYRMKETQRIMNRFFEPNAKFEEKRVIVNKLFESVTIGRGTNKKYSMTFNLREEFVDFFSD